MSFFVLRTFHVHETQRRRRLSKGAITRRRRTFSYRILTTYEKAFEKFGFFLARRPQTVLLVSLIAAVVCCLGLIRVSFELPSCEHFTVSNSQSRRDLDHAAQFFPIFEARQEQIVMIPGDGQNILSDDCIRDAFFIHQVVLNISDYEDLCLRQLLPKSTAEKSADDNCIISSPLELGGAHFENLSDLPSILAREWTNPMKLLSTGQSFNFSFKMMLSNFEVNHSTNPMTARADALRVIYFMKKSTNKEQTHKVLNFEKLFENRVSSAKDRLKCATLYFRTEKARTDVLQNALRPEIRPLYLSSLITVLLVATVIYFSSRNLNCLTAVLLIFLSILVPLVCAAGIFSMANISFSSTTLFVPFLIVGKAISDIVFVLREWKRQENVLSLEHRTSSCVARAGTLQAVSAFTGAILLGIAIKSSFEVISTFFMVALIAYVLVSAASFVITVTFMLLLKRQLKSLNTFCASSNDRLLYTNFGILNKETTEILSNKLRRFLDDLSWALSSTGAKAISTVIFFSIATSCVILAVQPGERTSVTTSLHRQNDNFNQFHQRYQMFFGTETSVSIVFAHNVDYSEKNVQNQIIDICRTVGESSYSQEESVCWIRFLLQWAKERNLSCSNSEFYTCLNMFLNQSSNIDFRQDLRFNENNPHFRILASRIHVQMVQNSNFGKNRASLEKLRHDLLRQSLLQAAPVSHVFFELDDLFTLKREVVFALIISAVVVFVLSLLSTSFIRISTYITVTFIFLLLETAGIMKVTEVHLNHITFISMFLAIVLALNLNLQVAHCFVFSEKQKVRQRMTSALRTIGWPVLIASLLEICGSILLGLIYPTLRDIFFLLIPLVLALGVIHALVISPPIITIFFEFLNSFHSPIEEGIPMDLYERGKSLKLLEVDTSPLKSKRLGISIVGIGCRFPQANNKDLFWELLEQGKSSNGPFPQNRKEQHETFFQLYHPRRFVSGRLCAVNGSYLEKIQNFDNRFFGISNQEARGMDPQQRILLEVVYEAIEDAGMRLEDLQKCKTGVFVGVMNLEFGALVTDTSNYNNIDQFSSTGMTASILANRVSFCLNFTGPSIAVDTACSSSLTALKLACDNLHNGDCDIAIVSAPNIVLNHGMQMVSSMAGLLAPDGRCKSFDASGDGYGRGEGFAAVILKLSHAAVNDKDDAYCEIIACGMNNDGQDAIPMTAPSSRLQAGLSRMVLEQSGVNAEDVSYFEAHGTGTAIGDVIEVTSIADTYTRGTTNPTRKLRIGSVKSNLNHTESTSGLAGLIKVALMINKKRLVPTVNVQIVNPKLRLEDKGLIVQQTSEPWNTENGKHRIAAVNSFGYGGSNVHVILREVIRKKNLEEEKVNRVNSILTISARSPEALKRMARLYSNWLNDRVQDPNSSFLENLCYSLNERRSRFPHRLALSFESISEASKALLDYADGSVGWEKVACYDEVKSCNTKLVFMFGGQGSQWYAMGRQLVTSEPVFKEAILAVSNLVQGLGKPWSIVDELMASQDETRITENSISQPATFAIQYATAQLLMSWRIYPSAVLGHSLGEFAAACTAGIITLKEAIQLVLTRSALQDQCPNNGGMAALGMSEEKARNLLTELKLSPTLSIAAVNDANSVTVSGDSGSIEALGQHLAIHSKHTFWRVLGTKRAFHSAHMELIKRPFQAEVRRIKLKPQLSRIPMYSTVEGEIISGEQFNRNYWWRNIRCPVQFQPAIKNVLKDGHKHIIEISTQPILAHYVKEIAIQENLRDQAMPIVLATLPRKKVPVDQQHKFFLLNTVCRLYTTGFPVDWSFVQRNPSAKFIRLLSYPWLENSFWYRENSPKSTISPVGTEISSENKTHPFLGKVKMTDLYSGLHCWETEIDLHRFPNLRDHALTQGGPVMPGAAYVEMAFAMVKDQFVDVAGLELSNVKISSLLTLPETQVSKLNKTQKNNFY